MNFDFRKKGTKLPELGSWGGGLGNSGNARKKTFFFNWPLPLLTPILQSYRRISYLWFKDISQWYASMFVGDIAPKMRVFPLLKSDTWMFKRYTQGVRIDKMGGEVGRKHVARKKVIFWDLALRTKTATPPSNIPDIWHNFDIASLIDEASKTCAWNYDKIAIITVCFSFFRLIFHPVPNFTPEFVVALMTNIKKVHSSTTSTPGATALFWPKSQLLGLLGTSQVLQHKWW